MLSIFHRVNDISQHEEIPGKKLMSFSECLKQETN